MVGRLDLDGTAVANKMDDETCMLVWKIQGVAGPGLVGFRFVISIFRYFVERVRSPLW